MTAELAELLLEKVKQGGNCKYITCGTLAPLLGSVGVVGPKKAVAHMCIATFYFYCGCHCCSLGDQNA